MQIYKCSKAIIKSWQYQHPALRNLSDAICRLIDTRSGAALDVGCGTGRTSIMLARKGLRVDAVDIEPKVIAIARQIAEKEGFQVNFSVEDFSKEIHSFAGPYDIIVCSEVLEHVADHRSVIANMYDRLGAGGLLIVTVPHDPRQFSLLDCHGGHLRRFSIQQLKQDLSRLQMIDCFTIGFPCMRLMTYLHILMLSTSGRSPSPEKLLEHSVFGGIFYSFVYHLAKIDNLFNRLNKGTNIVCAAKK